MVTKKAPAKSTVAKKVPRKTVSVHRGASPTPELPPKFAQHLLELERAFAQVLDDVVSRYPHAKIIFNITAGVITLGGGPPVNADGDEVKGSLLTISNTDVSRDRWVFIAYPSDTAIAPSITHVNAYEKTSFANNQVIQTITAKIRRLMDLASDFTKQPASKFLVGPLNEEGTATIPQPRRRAGINFSPILSLSLANYVVRVFRLPKSAVGMQQASVNWTALPQGSYVWTRLALTGSEDPPA